jgi:hypothetical protein
MKSDGVTMQVNFAAPRWDRETGDPALRIHKLTIQGLELRTCGPLPAGRPAIDGGSIERDGAAWGWEVRLGVGERFYRAGSRISGGDEPTELEAMRRAECVACALLVKLT